MALRWNVLALAGALGIWMATAAPVLADRPAGPAASGDLAARIDAIFASIAGKNLPGAAVLVMRDDEVVHARGYGLASIELGVPVNSYVAIYPSERLAIVVLSNVSMRPAGPLPTAGDLAHQVLEVVAGDRLGPQWPGTIALAPALLDRYVGRYRLEAAGPVVAVMGDSVEISREGERLFAAGKQGRAELFAESETAFFSKAGPVRVEFLKDQSGFSGEAVLSLMGLREFRLRRLP